MITDMMMVIKIMAMAWNDGIGAIGNILDNDDLFLMPLRSLSFPLASLFVDIGCAEWNG